MVEGHERWSHEWDLEPNFELESFKKSEEAKCQKNANRDIYKMVKPSYFHVRIIQPLKSSYQS